MKYFLVIMIMVESYLIGISKKNTFKNRLAFLNYLQNFVNFLNSNINLFKNNVVEIIEKFLALPENKNAKYNEIFVKNAQIYEINSEKIEKYSFSQQDKLIIFGYLSNIGSNEYEFETSKNQKFIELLNDKIKLYLDEKRVKVDLFFKLALSVGAVISILIW